MRRWTFLWVNRRCITFPSPNLSLFCPLVSLLAYFNACLSERVPFFCVLISCARFTFRFIIRFDGVCSLLLYLFHALLLKDLPFASSSKTKFSKLCVWRERSILNETWALAMEKPKILFATKGQVPIYGIIPIYYTEMCEWLANRPLITRRFFLLLWINLIFFPITRFLQHNPFSCNSIDS